MGSNGVISFGSSYDDYINREFTSTFREYLVAPFWDDININNGGTISYEIFESGYYLEQVNAYIQRKRPTDFEGTWMMNVYYKEVSPFAGDGEVHMLNFFPLPCNTLYTSVKIIKNEVGCRDDTVPKTVDTRRHCEEE